MGAVSILDLTIEIFGADLKKPVGRIYLLYDGIHYDLLVRNEGIINKNIFLN